MHWYPPIVSLTEWNKKDQIRKIKHAHDSYYLQDSLHDVRYKIHQENHTCNKHFIMCSAYWDTCVCDHLHKYCSLQIFTRCFDVIVTCYAQCCLMNRITTKIEMGNIQHEITLSLDAVWLAYMLYELIKRPESMYSFLLSKCCPAKCSKLPPSFPNCNIVICTLLPIVPWDQMSWLVRGPS